MLKSLLAALGLVLVMEGILPFVSPQQWRKTLLLFAAQKDKSLRRIGLISMLVGLVVIVMAHRFL